MQATGRPPGTQSPPILSPTLPHLVPTPSHGWRPIKCWPAAARVCLFSVYPLSQQQPLQ
eukprot:COSAG01_NODE_1735_length_9365_cov_3.816318_5_plen_59_part_00